MRIADILETKGRTVHSIRLWKTVADVVTELGRARVGALLVLDAHDTIVRTCTSDMLVADAMAAMTAGRHRHLPVVDNGQVVGLVSIGDLVKNRVREMELETGVLRDTVIARS